PKPIGAIWADDDLIEDVVSVMGERWRVREIGPKIDGGTEFSDDCRRAAVVRACPPIFPIELSQLFFGLIKQIPGDGVLKLWLGGGYEEVRPVSVVERFLSVSGGLSRIKSGSYRGSQRQEPGDGSNDIKPKGTTGPVGGFLGGVR